MTSIVHLPARIARLEGDPRRRADRLLDARVVLARTDPPPELVPWLDRVFGSVDAVRDQTIVKVTNIATLEEALFAPLRRLRPVQASNAVVDVAREVEASRDGPFCHPATDTPADTFGRISGRRMLTGANAAQADAHHGVLVFDVHDPLAFDADLVADLFATGRSWADAARRADPAAANYLLIWNCLWRAGGSIIHGHAQALLGSGRHYAAVERYRRAADAYAVDGRSSLVSDLVALHRDIGLGLSLAGAVTLLAHVTPTKERELMIVGRPGMDEREPAFTDAVARALVAYRDRIGVRSFNLALWRPPLPVAGDAATDWEWLPPIVRIVDRGDPSSRSSDIGAMELYGTPIVGADPYELVDELTGAIEVE